MARATKDLSDGPVLHHFASVQDDDLVSQVRDDTKIMCDQKQAQTAFALQRFQQAENLCLDRNVECSRRLIGDQQRWIADECHGDHCALAQTTRHLERVHIKSANRIGKADLRQHRLGERANVGSRNGFVNCESF